MSASIWERGCRSAIHITSGPAKLNMPGRGALQNPNEAETLQHSGLLETAEVDRGPGDHIAGLFAKLGALGLGYRV